MSIDIAELQPAGVGMCVLGIGFLLSFNASLLSSWLTWIERWRNYYWEMSMVPWFTESIFLADYLKPANKGHLKTCVLRGFTSNRCIMRELLLIIKLVPSSRSLSILCFWQDVSFQLLTRLCFFLDPILLVFVRCRSSTSDHSCWSYLWSQLLVLPLITIVGPTSDHNCWSSFVWYCCSI